jgi:hypothetical protein
MSMTQGTEGPRQIGPGTPAELRLGATRELIVGHAHSRYHEAVSRGTVFHASMQAASALGAALTATAVTLTLYNPSGSGVLLVPLRVRVGISTIPAANAIIALVGNVNPLAAAPTATTAAVIRCNKLNQIPGRGQAFTAATLPAVPVVLCPLGTVLAGTATATMPNGSEELAGEFELPENTAVTIQAIGSAVSGIVSLSWEEIPT